jgi:hypothetical protein
MTTTEDFLQPIIGQVVGKVIHGQPGQQRRACETADDSRRASGGQHRCFRGVFVIDGQHLDKLFGDRQSRRFPLNVLADLLQEPAASVIVEVLGNL